MVKKLEKYTLSRNKEKETWDLKKDKTENILKRYETKKEATKGGELEQVLGPDGGSVKIKKVDGRIQEERTYPGNKDPKESEG